MADAAPPARPRLPQRGGSRPPQRNATFLALAGLLGAAVALAGLVVAVMTGFAPAAIVVVLPIVIVVTLLFGGHYLVWGVWLDRMHASRGTSQPVEFWKRAPLPPSPLPDDEAEG
ncbi:MAG TPA: hypothetical protein VM452_02705 [Caulifigura sp.]|nr:hypothetical protein [Caulifigura sp.]